MYAVKIVPMCTSVFRAPPNYQWGEIWCGGGDLPCHISRPSVRLIALCGKKPQNRCPSNRNTGALGVMLVKISQCLVKLQ